MSHPVWVRGLKLLLVMVPPQKLNVAPRVGAWIETSFKVYPSILNNVAPRVGAWIETSSPPLCRNVGIWSHPVWVRGLKRSVDSLPKTRHLSHPVWVRGLKLRNYKINITYAHVAPRVGAWIGTYALLAFTLITVVAPRVGAWIETLPCPLSSRDWMSHPVWVRGLKLFSLSSTKRQNGRTPCGCVD